MKVNAASPRDNNTAPKNSDDKARETKVFLGIRSLAAQTLVSILLDFRSDLPGIASLRFYERMRN